MAASSGDEALPQSGAYERDVGWGGRDWAGSGEVADASDSDLERLRAERPPHHEDRDR